MDKLIEKIHKRRGTNCFESPMTSDSRE
jgi:hypothetical protein